jgi:hypothetical protein
MLDFRGIQVEGALGHVVRLESELYDIFQAFKTKLR